MLTHGVEACIDCTRKSFCLPAPPAAFVGYQSRHVHGQSGINSCCSLVHLPRTRMNTGRARGMESYTNQ